jgi:uncharacterized metal-binding protein YceD (DUF177 family)
MKNSTENTPFSYLVKVGNVSANPVDVHLEADKQELQALAETWDVIAVEDFRAELQIGRWKKDGVRVKGRVRASIVQACVVTLEPVPSKIDETFEQIFVPENSKLARRPANNTGEMVLDPDGPDMPESFVGDTIDAGEVVTEFAAMAIDPYPRKEGVAFEGHIEDTGENDKKPSAFAVLKDWKKD